MDAEKKDVQKCARCGRTTTSFVCVLLPTREQEARSEWCGRRLCPECRREVFTDKDDNVRL